MADPEAAQYARQGPRTWNAYVRTQPASFKADLNRANLSRATLIGGVGKKRVMSGKRAGLRGCLRMDLLGSFGARFRLLFDTGG